MRPDVQALLQLGLLNRFASKEYEWIFIVILGIFTTFASKYWDVRSIGRRIEDVVDRYVCNRNCVVRNVRNSFTISKYGTRRLSDPYCMNGVMQKAILSYVMSSDYRGRYRPHTMAKGDIMLMDVSSHASGELMPRASLITKPADYAWSTIYDDEKTGDLIQCRRLTFEREMEKEMVMNTDDLEIRAYSASGCAEKLVNEFLEKAYEHYRVERERVFGDNELYYFLPVPSKHEDSGRTVYKKFVMGSEKTFDTLYHPETESIRTLVDAFVARAGKFSVPGFPYKLSFLLHGPPGTGKTTFIKALANHTKRHVVNISLEKIKTNTEFHDIMYDEKYALFDDYEEVIRLKNEQVIFVLEDIDAAGKVVHRRDKRVPDGDDGYGDLSADKDGALMQKLLKNVEDRLSLSGILNAMDGVLSSPGRMVVMTTNHAEKLDPALLRPGRVNRWIKMDFLRAAEARRMFSRFFPEEDEEKMVGVFEGLEQPVSPALFETLCGSCATVEEFLAQLEKA